MNNEQQANSSHQQLSTQKNKPNETAGFYLSGVIRITDPNTGQVLLHKRADE